MIRTASRRLVGPRPLWNASSRAHPNSLAAVESSSPSGTAGGDTSVSANTSTLFFTSHSHGFTTFAAKLVQTERRERQEEPAPRDGQELEQQPQQAQEFQRAVPEEIVSTYRSKMQSLQKRRKRVPLSAGESYESWLDNNDELLEPLRDFFRLHEIDASWAIAELYKNGYWGKKLMTDHARRDRGNVGRMNGNPDESTELSDHASRFPWETALDTWSAAFEAEKLPHSPMDIVRRWPSLLCKTPDCLPGTVAVLRAAVPNEDALNDMISQFPRVLVQSPVKLQHRVLALQMACGMDLSRILPKNPQLFYRNLDAIMANIRFLRENSWTLEHFESLIEYRPNILSMHPDMVKKNTESTLEALKMILPDGADPKMVVRAKPQLILISAAHIDERWNILKSMTDQVPEWQAELEEAIQDVVDASGGSQISASIEGEEGSEGDEASVMDWDRGEWGATTLGSGLWSHPKRYERMQYLLASGLVGHGAEGGTSPSFVDILTVHLHRFQHRYNGFKEWAETHGS